VFIDGTIRYPLPRALTTELLAKKKQPTSFTSAVKDAVWRQAMSEEFNALIYVDDIILTGLSNNVLSHLIATLSHDFPIKDLGNLNFFLGVEVIRTAKGLLLSQQR
jgi:hypothetical protein